MNQMLSYVPSKPEPIMLLILPIILSRIPQNFFPLFSMPSPIILIIFFNFYCVSENDVHNLYTS